VVTTEAIKTLRDLTGIGIMECKRALEEAQGDIKKAEQVLLTRGATVAAKKSSRDVNEGLIDSYIHSGSRVGAIVEVNCETDFVARTPDFQDLAHDLAMQVAAMAPLYVDQENIPEGEEGAPQVVSLLQQPFIKDPSLTVKDVINSVVGKVGENIRVRRFTRFALGE